MLVKAIEENWGQTAKCKVNSDNSTTWSIYTPEYRIALLTGSINDRRTYFNIHPQSTYYDYPPINLDLADETVVDATNRNTKWEDALLPDYIPKLTDYISSIKTTNGTNTISWDRMNLAETEAVIKKLLNAFEKGYTYEIRMSNATILWTFTATINDIPVTVTVSYKEKNTYSTSPTTVVEIKTLS